MNKIVAYDFDKTLVKGSVNIMIEQEGLNRGLTLNQAVDYYIKVFGNPFSPNIDYIHYPGVIVSFGYKKVIKKFLKKFNYSHLFLKIYTPADFGLDEGIDQRFKLMGKNIMLQKIMKDFKINLTENILIVDDSTYIIKMAQADDFRTSKVRNNSSISKNNIKDINMFLHL